MRRLKERRKPVVNPFHQRPRNEQNHRPAPIGVAEVTGRLYSFRPSHVDFALPVSDDAFWGYGRAMFKRGMKQLWRPLIGIVVAYAVAAQSLLIVLGGFSLATRADTATPGGS